MKQLALAAALTAAAALFGFLPFPRRDVAELKPVQTLVVELGEGGTVVLTADGGLWGEGAGWEQAVERMEQTCPGHLFLSTAEQVIFVEKAANLVPQAAADTRLRPAANIYLADRAPEPETATKYLKTRDGDLTLSKVRTSILQSLPFRLPSLQIDGDRIYFVEGSYDGTVS